MGAKSFDLSRVYHTQTESRLSIAANTFSLSEFSVEICLSRGSDSNGEFGFVQDGNKFLLVLNGASTGLFRTYNDSGNLIINTQPNIGDTTVPRTMTLTYDGSLARMYVDGTQRTSATQTMTALNANLIRIGSTYLYNSGSLFTIKIYNRSLTADEVRANAEIDKGRFL